MSLTLPGGVKRASLRHRGKELSLMRYDGWVPSSGVREGTHGASGKVSKFVPVAGLALVSGLPSATRGQDNTLLSRMNRSQFSGLRQATSFSHLIIQ